MLHFRKLANLARESGIPEPSLKERRFFQVEWEPSLTLYVADALQRLSLRRPDIQSTKCSELCTKLFTRCDRHFIDEDEEPLEANVAHPLRVAVRRFYGDDVLSATHVGSLSISPTSKVMARGRGASIRRIAHLSALQYEESEGCIASLEHVSRVCGSDWRDAPLEGDLLSCPIIEKLLELMADNVSDLEAFQSVSELLERECTTVYTCKNYPSRGDVRCYGRSTDVKTTLCGCILQQLYRPSNEGARSRCQSCRVWPAVDSNKLNKCINIKRNTEVNVIIGDLSSFTFNFISVVALLLGSLLNTYDSEDWFIVNIEDALFEALLRDVLFQYLYETLFIQGYDSYLGDTFVTPGSALGVSGGITLALVGFSGALHFARSRLCQRFPRTYKIDVQVGGDDYFLAVISEDLCTLSFGVQEMENFVRRYVGHIKSPSLTHPSEEDSISEIEFCKKEVDLRCFPCLDGSMDLVVTSQFGFTLCRHLVEGPDEGTSWKEHDAEFIRTVFQEAELYSGTREEANLLVRLAIRYYEKHHNRYIEEVPTKKYDLRGLSLVPRRGDGALHVTFAAQGVLKRVLPRYCHSGHTVELSRRLKLALLQPLEILTVESCDFTGKMVLLTTVEASTLPLIRGSLCIPRHEDRQLLECEDEYRELIDTIKLRGECLEQLFSPKACPFTCSHEIVMQDEVSRLRNNRIVLADEDEDL